MLLSLLKNTIISPLRNGAEVVKEAESVHTLTFALIGFVIYQTIQFAVPAGPVEIPLLLPFYINVFFFQSTELYLPAREPIAIGALFVFITLAFINAIYAGILNKILSRFPSEANFESLYKTLWALDGYRFLAYSLICAITYILYYTKTFFLIRYELYILGLAISIWMLALTAIWIAKQANTRILYVVSSMILTAIVSILPFILIDLILS